MVWSNNIKKLVLTYTLVVGFTALTFVASSGGSSSNKTLLSDFDVAPNATVFSTMPPMFQPLSIVRNVTDAQPVTTIVCEGHWIFR